MKKKIILLGSLGEKYGRTHLLNVNSVGESIRALQANFPDFERYITRSTEDNVGYQVLVGDKETEKDEELLYPLGEKGTITIAPVVSGSGAVVRIIAGVVLIAVGAVVGYIAGWTGVGAVVAGALISTGIGLVLGGVVQLLTPVPKIDGPQEKEENRPSTFFNGPVNTTAQGQPVAIFYGEGIIGGAIISAGVSVEDVPIA